MSLPQIFTAVRLHPPNSVSSKSKTVKHKYEDANGVASGSFREAEDMYRRRIIVPTTRDGSRDLRQEERPAQSNSLVVEPVKVDGIVMDYIEKMKSKELDIIKKRNAVIMKRDDRYVTFMSPSGTSVHAQFAREQFITLYQKIATGLQTRTYDCSQGIIAHCQAEFPELLITHKDERRLQLTGNFISLERFETFSNGSAQTYSHYQTPNKTKVNDTPYKQPVKQQKSIDQAKDEACPICLETLKISECTVLSKCKHRFCKDCLERAFHVKPTCPICGEIYGNLTGTQPKGGTMTVSSDRSSLPGYERYGTIIISYHIPSGYQGDEHPNPGMPYQGATRIAYLPYSTEGNKVLKLLQRAFDQRLTFTIGRSSTTGQNNVVTWNDIHHKTSRYGGPTCYGYPDPDYLKRVQDELKAKGID
ncbi:probable E3 ubiquitin-protein ligase DTX2 [Sinocyclocheilus anshuiensis]|uniref:E3 ubiquitin-protein ligase n=1 Tax=Sinocyclocheilus anshuiensis TaxID=1608454 RepID=A0A671RZ73_9TELE|nr:PREDICTED: probable E3 ubiquitin-protein ligase DTX2 [Sinocyclocheilus anshuiensis]